MTTSAILVITLRVQDLFSRLNTSCFHLQNAYHHPKRLGFAVVQATAVTVSRVGVYAWASLRS